jgi:hypothetical protein
MRNLFETSFRSLTHHAVIVTATIAVGCGSTDSTGDSRDSGAEMICGQAGNTRDGVNACNATTCDRGTYCAGVNCLVGCESTANCARGEYCDLRTTTKSFNNVPLGTCRAPDACDASPIDSGSSASCGNVAASYTFATGSGSTPECKEIFNGLTCTVTQADCVVTLSCPGDTARSFTIDSDNHGTMTATIQGATINCEFTFTPGAGATYTCQATSSQGSLVCKGTGSQT